MFLILAKQQKKVLFYLQEVALRCAQAQDYASHALHDKIVLFVPFVRLGAKKIPSAKQDQKTVFFRNFPCVQWLNKLFFSCSFVFFVVNPRVQS
jgi:hypothetical protein